RLIQKLGRAGFDGILAVETDFLHPDYGDDEQSDVAASVQEFRRWVTQAEDRQGGSMLGAKTRV
ncbi:MAG: hypothetical protein JO028_15435, partial [Acidobacteriaceae bacterium]|nr:hypothetical protein [Acidobacteriaceae bacterium]